MNKKGWVIPGWLIISIIILVVVAAIMIQTKGRLGEYILNLMGLK